MCVHIAVVVYVVVITVVAVCIDQQPKRHTSVGRCILQCRVNLGCFFKIDPQAWAHAFLQCPITLGLFWCLEIKSAHQRGSLSFTLVY